jgi:signal transduction histidine kinase
MSRIENNKFEVQIDSFDPRKCLSDVCDIMKFQAESKGLQLSYAVSENIPSSIKADSKRYK